MCHNVPTIVASILSGYRMLLSPLVVDTDRVCPTIATIPNKINNGNVQSHVILPLEGLAAVLERIQEAACSCLKCLCQSRTAFF